MTRLSLLTILCLAVLGSPTAAHAGPTLVDTFTTPFAQDPNFPSVGHWDNGNYLPGTGPNWYITSGTGQLTIGMTPTGAQSLPANSWNDGPHVQTAQIFTGDFTATITIDIAAAVSSGAGFFMDNASGYAGFGFATWGIGFNRSFGPSINTNIAATSATFQFIRTGDHLTAQYAEANSNQYTVLYSAPTPEMAGAIKFDLTFGVNGNPGVSPNAVSFSNFSVTSGVPDGNNSLILLGVSAVGLAAVRARRRL